MTIPRDPATSIDPAWVKAAHLWGVLAAIGLLAGSILYLLAAFNVLGAPPEYVPTSAGQLRDEAVYGAALFAYRHAIWWDFYGRDVLLFLANVGLLAVLVAVDSAAGGRPHVRLGVVFGGVGAMFGAVNAVTFLVITEYWKGTGWDAIPDEIMVAVARATEMGDGISRWFGTASNTAFAIGLAYLALAARRGAGFPRWVGMLAGIGAVVLAAQVILTQIPFDSGPAWDLLALAMGVIIAPLLSLGLAWSVERVAAARAATT